MNHQFCNLFLFILSRTASCFTLVRKRRCQIQNRKWKIWQSRRVVVEPISHSTKYSINEAREQKPQLVSHCMESADASCLLRIQGRLFSDGMVPLWLVGILFRLIINRLFLLSINLVAVSSLCFRCFDCTQNQNSGYAELHRKSVTIERKQS